MQTDNHFVLRILWSAATPSIEMAMKRVVSPFDTAMQFDHGTPQFRRYACVDIPETTWVFFSDDDDLWPPFRVEALRQMIPGAKIESDVRFLTHGYYVTTLPVKSWRELDVSNVKYHLDQAAIEHWSIVTPAEHLHRFCSTSTVLDNKYADMAFTTYMRTIGGKVGMIDAALYLYHSKKKFVHAGCTNFEMRFTDMLENVELIPMRYSTLPVDEICHMIVEYLNDIFQCPTVMATLEWLYALRHLIAEHIVNTMGSKLSPLALDWSRIGQNVEKLLEKKARGVVSLKRCKALDADGVAQLRSSSNIAFAESRGVR
jgi:hypothetical protein